MIKPLTYTLALLLSLTSPFALTHTSPLTTTGQPTTIAPVLKVTTPSIVNIMVEKKPPTFLDMDSSEGKINPKDYITIGSGVIFNAKKGYIITNAHVLKNYDTIMVTLKNGQHLRSRLIGKDDDFDIGVIQVPAQSLTALPIGDSDQLQAGDFVIAIGSPFGLNQTVTSGMVSALDRSNPPIEKYQSFIQTDAPINPGNSGGALVNLQGELIGINTALVGPGANVGIGFAIPSNMAMAVAKQLIQYHQLTPSMLGVIAQHITPALQTAFHLNNQQGALVAQVIPHSPADRAGFQPGDVITRLNNTAINSAEQLRNKLALTHPNTTLNAHIIRHQKTMTLHPQTVDINTPVDHNPSLLAGINFQDFDDIEMDGKRLQGALITHVSEKSQAAIDGFLPGDIIFSMNGQPVDSTQSLQRILSKNKQHPALIHLMREHHAMYIAITPSTTG